MVRFRDYQSECLDVISGHFKKHDRQLIQLPTGSGKTFIFLKYLRENSKRALVLAPTKDLCDQICKNALNFFHHSEVSRFKKNAHITVLTRNAIMHQNSIDWLLTQNFDHIVFDEAHKAYANSFINFLERYKADEKQIKILGFTATPERLDRKCLLDIFDHITYEKNIYDLIEQNFLCDIKAYRIKTKFKIKSKSYQYDLANSQLKHLDNITRNSIILGVYEKNCTKKKTLIFCLSVEHSDKMAAMLKDKGYRAASIHGKTSMVQRREILKEFSSNKLDVLCNCQLLTEGFDEPSIENIIIARPTKSKALYCQMIGRSLRPFPGKEYAKVYELTDQAHNICNFDVIAGADVENCRDYTNGVSLRERHKQIISFDYESLETENQEFNLLEYKNNFFEEEALNHQLELLYRNNISYIKPISFLEASFLLWKHKLKVKYGHNN